jgi:hypothetical protein
VRFVGFSGLGEDESFGVIIAAGSEIILGKEP